MMKPLIILAIALTVPVAACAAGEEEDETESGASSLHKARPTQTAGETSSSSSSGGDDAIVWLPLHTGGIRDLVGGSSWYCVAPTPWLCRGGIAGYKCFKYENCTGTSAPAQRH